MSTATETPSTPVFAAGELVKFNGREHVVEWASETKTTIFGDEYQTLRVRGPYSVSIIGSRHSELSKLPA